MIPIATGNDLVKSGHLDCKDWKQSMAEAIRQAKAGGGPDNGVIYDHDWHEAMKA